MTPFNIHTLFHHIYPHLFSPGCKSFYYSPSLTETIVCFIPDFVNSVSGFISSDQFCDKYGKIIPHFQYISLIDASLAVYRQSQATTSEWYHL